MILCKNCMQPLNGLEIRYGVDICDPCANWLEYCENFDDDEQDDA